MVSSGGSSGSKEGFKRTWGLKGQMVECKHQREAVVKVAGTPKNMGRSFYRCPLWKDRNADCGFFRWIDESSQGYEGASMAESCTAYHGLSAKHRNSEIALAESVQIVESLHRQFDERASTVDKLGEEIRVLRQSVVGLETKIGYVIVCMCLQLLFLAVIFRYM
ncbi:hypothetical protein LINPERHAP2_LOCUS30384 [Linum perenne]